MVGDATRIGIEGSHLTLAMQSQMMGHLPGASTADIAPDSMRQRMTKSTQARLIRSARVAVGGQAIGMRRAPGVSELEVAQTGRAAMKRLARCFRIRKCEIHGFGFNRV